MDMETVSPNFEDIRPLNDNEVQDAIEQLLANDEFRRAIRYIKPNIDWVQFAERMRSCKTKAEFKSTLSYDAVSTVIKMTTFSLTLSGRSRLPKDKKACTFISNHRDIVLDASFLNILLFEAGYGMTQVAMGDNLLIRPWIETFVKLNNSFIVKRGVSIRQMLEVSRTLSAYINHTIKDTKDSIWIAQREGRAKDSNDRTQPSVLKMLAMSGDKNTLKALMDLNIVPVSISYEYGLYGSIYSATSFKNQYSAYGSPYSSLSPYNPYTSTPPIIYLRGQRVGFLSKNKYLFGSIDPDSINTWMQNNGLYY